MIQLVDAAITGYTVDLPDDLHWVDEFDWSPVAQSAEYTMGGSLVIQQTTKLNGRPITLGGAYDDMGWVTRATVNKLIAMRDANRNVLTEYMVLTLWVGEPYQKQFNVFFRQSDTPVEATPVIMWKQQEDEHYYTLVLKLMEV